MTKRMSHVGISVADLDRSITFYQQMLRMDLVAQRPFDGGLYARILALESPRGRVALLRAGDLQIELFQFLSPTPLARRPDRPVCDHGITHFCIELADLDSEYARLSAAGVTFHCPPLTFPGGAKATYARDPDGNVFELLEVLGRTS